MTDATTPGRRLGQAYWRLACTAEHMAEQLLDAGADLEQSVDQIRSFLKVCLNDLGAALNELPEDLRAQIGAGWAAEDLASKQAGQAAADADALLSRIFAAGFQRRSDWGDQA